jgi:ribonuclease HII
MRRFDPSLLPPTPDLQFETALWLSGSTHIAGIDEAGRGALAGPVAAGVVIFPSNDHLLVSMQGLRDSKQLTAAERSDWATRIHGTALAWGVAFASNDEIDELGIVPATHLAAQRALLECKIEVDHLLLDYLFLPEIDIPQTKLVKGDQRSLSIAAASVLAKTSRDAWMQDLDGAFPEYKLAVNKGYGTQQHLLALEHYGPTPIHRRTFAPLKHRLLEESDLID